MLWSFILSNNQQNSAPTTNGADKPSEEMRNAIPVYANHPFPPDYTASLARVPQGFSDLAVSSLLSMQCVRVIERIPFTPSSSEAAAISPRPDGADLHTILTDLMKLTTLKTTKLEHVLCFGLVAYCLPLQYGRPLPAGCTPTLQACVDAYMRLNLRENEEKLDGKCLLWIAVVLAAALDNCADEDLRHAPVLERVLNRFPQAKVWTTVEKILRSFLWHDSLVSRWYNTWQNVMQRRASPPIDAGISPVTFSPTTLVNDSPRSHLSYLSKQQSPNPAVQMSKPPRDERPGIKVSSLLIND
jgi:hypothetical protein